MTSITIIYGRDLAVEAGDTTDVDVEASQKAFVEIMQRKLQETYPDAAVVVLYDSNEVGAHTAIDADSSEEEGNILAVIASIETQVMSGQFGSYVVQRQALSLGFIRLVALDIDGTVTTVKRGQNNRPEFPRDPFDRLVRPDVRRCIDHLHARKQNGVGIVMALCSNQGNVAFGITDPVTTAFAIATLAHDLGIWLYYYAFDMVNGTVPRFRFESKLRKPESGMLLRAMEDAHASPGTTLYVGDREEDEQAAKAAGTYYLHVDAFIALVDEYAATVPIEEDFPF